MTLLLMVVLRMDTTVRNGSRAVSSSVLVRGFTALRPSGATSTTIFIPITAIKAPHHTPETDLRLRSPSIKSPISKEMKCVMGVATWVAARSTKNDAGQVLTTEPARRRDRD